MRGRERQSGTRAAMTPAAAARRLCVPGAPTHLARGALDLVRGAPQVVRPRPLGQLHARALVGAGLAAVLVAKVAAVVAVVVLVVAAVAAARVVVAVQRRNLLIQARQQCARRGIGCGEGERVRGGCR